jgi:Na+/H+-translocating membrane pyrophosphatase
LAISLQAAVLPVTVIAAGIWIAYSVGRGPYGVALAVVAMLSMAGMVVAVDSYGPITANAGGIAEVSELAHEVRTITDALDAVGNTTQAMVKVYAISSAATTTSMGRLPTGMTRSTLPVLSSRTLTVSLPVLAMTTWPLARRPPRRWAL